MAPTQAMIGHLAMHYRPGDEEQARRLFELLGCTLVQNGPSPGTDGFSTIVVDPGSWNYVDNVLYLARASEAQLGLEAAIAENLHAGQADEDPRLSAYRALRAEWPEALTHVGIRYSTFDALERAVLAVETATAPGGELEGRASITKFRARSGLDAEIDAVMAATPIFGPDDRSAFVEYGVQCFVKTDLCAAGLLTLGQTIELDFAFPPAFEKLPSYGRA
jgi:hypothetical protein